jgi:hypothetical protein
VQLVILSLLMQDVIQSKEALDQAKKGLIQAAETEAGQQLLSSLINTNDYHAFNEHVLKEKDRLLAYAKPHASVSPPPASPPPAQTAPVAPPTGT